MLSRPRALRRLGADEHPEHPKHPKHPHSEPPPHPYSIQSNGWRMKKLRTTSSTFESGGSVAQRLT